MDLVIPLCLLSLKTRVHIAKFISMPYDKKLQYFKGMETAKQHR